MIRACSETPPCLECAPLGYDAFVSSSMYHRYISDSDSRLAFKAAHFGLGTRVSEHALVYLVRQGVKDHSEYLLVSHKT